MAVTNTEGTEVTTSVFFLHPRIRLKINCLICVGKSCSRSEGKTTEWLINKFCPVSPLEERLYCEMSMESMNNRVLFFFLLEDLR